MKKFNPKNITCSLAIMTILTITAGIYAQKKTDDKEMSCPMMAKMPDRSKSHEDCPMMKPESNISEMKMDANMSNHSEHQKMVMENGTRAMGFSQTATTHHFLIMKDGGAIQVEANDTKDTDNRD